MRRWWVLGVSIGVVLPSVIAAESPAVLINELFYDAPGSDTGQEWIELINTGGAPADLSGWKVQRGGTAFATVFTFPDGVSIAFGQLLLIGEQNVAGVSYAASLVFQNGGEVTDGVRLVADDGAVADVILYDEPNTSGLPDASGSPGSAFAPDVAEGHSLARIPDGTGAFVDTASPTPGATNASVSSPASPSPSPASSPAPSGDPASAQDVIVNEVLPNPAGADEEGEFMELWNSGSQAANLTGFSVDDAEGGSKTYVLAAGTTLGPKSYLVLRRPDTKLRFNQDADRARLLRPGGSVQSELGYDVVPGEGQAYARKLDGSAAWTEKPTPGAANEFVTSAVPGNVSKTAVPTIRPSPTAKTSRGAPPSSRVRGTAATAASASRRGTGGERTRGAQPAGTARDDAIPPAEVAIGDLPARDLGLRVRTRGVVSVAPGTFDARLLYLAGSGIGVVLTSGAFPPLALGDTVEVTGTLAEPRKERFLAVATPEEIVKKEPGPPPEPHEVKTGEVGEAWEGSLVRVSGRVTRGDEKTLVLNDGSGDAQVAAAAAGGRTLPAIVPGSTATVTGVVSAADAGHRVLPRSPGDVVVATARGASRPPWRRPSFVIAGACFVLATALFLARRRGAVS